MSHLPTFSNSRRPAGGLDQASLITEQAYAAEQATAPPITTLDGSHGSDRTLVAEEPGLTKSQLKKATRTRKIFALLSSFFLFCSVIFMILVELGQTYNRSVLKDIYFLRLDLTNVFATTSTSPTLLNSIARTIGLHDFYQVGLWGFCEGYNTDGVTFCSEPQVMYWFNPVQILLNELLAGSSISIPAQLTEILNLIRIVSHLMFGFYLAGTCLAFVLVFISPLIVRSRWLAFLIGIFTFIAALLITGATVIATVLFIIFRNKVVGQTQVNIGASIGITMFGLMWTAAACSIFAFVIQLCLMCCCTSRRDVKKGKKRGSKQAYPEGMVMNEKPE